MSNSNIIKLDDIKNNIELKKLLEKLNPLSFIIYGSYAKSKANKTSDIDLMIFFKKNILLNKNIDLILKNIKHDLQYIFNKKIDFVVMIYTKKIEYDFDNNNDVNANFIQNVLGEGINLYGTDFHFIIEESYIYKKIL